MRHLHAQRPRAGAFRGQKSAARRTGEPESGQRVATRSAGRRAQPMRRTARDDARTPPLPRPRQRRDRSPGQPREPNGTGQRALQRSVSRRSRRTPSPRSRQPERFANDAAEHLSAAQVAQIAHIGVGEEPFGCSLVKCRQVVRMGDGRLPERGRVVVTFEVVAQRLDVGRQRVSARERREIEPGECRVRRMSVQRRLERRVNRLQVAQQQKIAAPVEPPAQQGRDERCALDLDVLRTGLALQPLGEIQGQARSKTGIASIIRAPRSAGFRRSAAQDVCAQAQRRGPDAILESSATRKRADFPVGPPARAGRAKTLSWAPSVRYSTGTRRVSTQVFSAETGSDRSDS